MNLYPAMRASMGRWNYFVVKMTMRELAESVKFAADVYEDKTLDDAIQRVLNESRVKKDIVTYLVRQEDHFFSSVVVAALGGEPKWYPVSIVDDERFQVFADDARFNSTFGVLRFDGTQNYYALDGQHRLAAIKALVDPNSDAYADAPRGFRDEEMSVLVVVPREAESTPEFMKRYRRLFGNLNRYAKAMDQVTNIIMDEDDAFAIVTRRLVSDHEFFKAPGPQKKSIRVKTTKGKNLRSGDPYFTSLETLYQMNITLLTSTHRRNHGWDHEGSDSKLFSRFRPDEEVIDELATEVELYWDGLIGVLPDLKRNPAEMRHHNIDDDHTTSDSVLFWPIGQELLAEVARRLLDWQQPDPREPTATTVNAALSRLKAIDWDLHSPPWRHLLLIPDSDSRSSWRMRSEDRRPATALAQRIVHWQLGIDELSDGEVNSLRKEWEGLLVPALPRDDMDDLWVQIEDAVTR